MSFRSECRICYHDDFVSNMVAPCGCKGGMELVHRNCVQDWCNWKKNTICEVCTQPYRGGYTIPTAEDTAIDIHGESSNNNRNNLMIEDAENDGSDEPQTSSEMKIVIICGILTFSAIIMMIKHAYEQVKGDDRGLGTIISEFASDKIFFIGVVALMILVYALYWLVNRSIRSAV